MGGKEVVHDTWKRSQEVRSVVGQNGFAGGEPVVTQNDVRGKAIENQKREAGVVATIISGDV